MTPGCPANAFFYTWKRDGYGQWYKEAGTGPMWLRTEMWRSPK